MSNWQLCHSRCKGSSMEHSASTRLSFSHSTQQGASKSQRDTTNTQEYFKQASYDCCSLWWALGNYVFEMQRKAALWSIPHQQVVIQPLNPARSIKISKRHDIHTGKIWASIIWLLLIMVSTCQLCVRDAKERSSMEHSASTRLSYSHSTQQGSPKSQRDNIYTGKLRPSIICLLLIMVRSNWQLRHSRWRIKEGSPLWISSSSSYLHCLPLEMKTSGDPRKRLQRQWISLAPPYNHATAWQIPMALRLLENCEPSETTKVSPNQ